MTNQRNLQLSLGFPLFSRLITWFICLFILHKLLSNKPRLVFNLDSLKVLMNRGKKNKKQTKNQFSSGPYWVVYNLRLQHFIIFTHKFSFLFYVCVCVCGFVTPHCCVSVGDISLFDSVFVWSVLACCCCCCCCCWCCWCCCWCCCCFSVTLFMCRLLNMACWRLRVYLWWCHVGIILH